MNHLECAVGNPRQNQLWKYIAVIVISFIAANTIGAIPMIIVAFIKVFENRDMLLSDLDSVEQMIMSDLMSGNLGLALLLFASIIALFALVLFFKPFHNRTLKQVINGTNRIRWNRFWMGIVVWGVILVLYLIIDRSIYPANYTFQFDITSFIPLVFITLIMMPFQTTYEELAFRGYLAQGIAAYTRNRWLVVIIPGVLFGLIHFLNPEVKEHGFWLMMPQYIFFGLFFGLITVLDDGIELAMGVHAINNIFVSLFTTNSSSVFQTPAVFSVGEIDPLKELVVLVISALLVLAFFYKKYKWSFSILNQRIENKTDEENEGRQELEAFK